jgi:hypothetical protein
LRRSRTGLGESIIGKVHALHSQGPAFNPQNKQQQQQQKRNPKSLENLECNWIKWKKKHNWHTEFYYSSWLHFFHHLFLHFCMVSALRFNSQRYHNIFSCIVNFNWISYIFLSLLGYLHFSSDFSTWYIYIFMLLLYFWFSRI